jgi:hypothetical protein
MIRKFETALDAGKAFVMTVNALAQATEHGENLALKLFDPGNARFHIRNVEAKLCHFEAKMAQDVENKIVWIGCHAHILAGAFPERKARIIALPRPK